MASLVVVFSCAIGSITIAGEWKAADNSMMSRWARDVSPQNVWQEYPRPQLVRDNWKNLNGLWDYAVLSKNSTTPTSYQGQILVPFCVESALSGVKKQVKPDDRIWYRTSFEIPSKWQGQRIILNFDAVDWDAAVWINHVLVGSHKGAYDRFSFDITDYLKSNGLQECIVSVWDPTSYGTQPRGKQQIPQQGIWYTPVSGIWQTVWLEAVPQKASIREIKITPDIDDGTVTILPMLFEPLAKKYEVEVTVMEGKKEVAKGATPADQPVKLKIDNPKLWSPDSPFLYNVKLSLLAPKQADKPRETIETVMSYFGMRKISLGDGPAGKIQNACYAAHKIKCLKCLK